MARLIDADAYVNVQLYDDEHEERYSERMTIAECIDLFTDEGCPQTIDAVEVVNGKWIEDYNNTYSRRRMKCSVCGKFSGIGGIKSNQLKPYCPNCGARMRGADDEYDK